jgi:hypothetical protein
MMDFCIEIHAVEAEAVLASLGQMQGTTSNNVSCCS